MFRSAFFSTPGLVKLTASFLPPQDRINSLRVSKFFSQQLRDSLLWQQEGVDSFQAFVERTKKLPEGYQKLVLSGVYRLYQAEHEAPTDDDKIALLVQQGILSEERASKLTEYEIQRISEFYLLISAGTIAINGAIWLKWPMRLKETRFQRLVLEGRMTMFEVDMFPPEKKLPMQSIFVGINPLITVNILTESQANELTLDQCFILGEFRIQVLLKARLLTIAKAKQLSIDECEQLIILQPLISANIFTIKEAIDMHLSEFQIIRNSRVQQLILFNLITIEEAKALTPKQFHIVSDKCISTLLIERFLTFEDAKKLTDWEFACLSHDFITRLIIAGKLAIEKARALPSNYFKSSEHVIYHNLFERLKQTVELILNGLVTIDDIETLTPEEWNNIKDIDTRALIKNDKLDFEAAKKLTVEQQFKISVATKLILADKIQLDEVFALSYNKIDYLNYFDLQQWILQGKLAMEVFLELDDASLRRLLDNRESINNGDIEAMEHLTVMTPNTFGCN